MTFNLDKYRIMIYSKSQIPIINTYHWCGCNILRICCILDTCFKFNISLNRWPHIEIIYCRAFKIFGFVMKRVYSYLKLKKSFKAFFAQFFILILLLGVRHTDYDACLILRV